MPETAAETSPAIAANGASAEGERIAAITGARFCIQCGFNLTGQTILREPKYDLLIARCPECGTVAPLQEYPPLSAWSRRWAITLAIAWLALVVALAIGTAAIAGSAPNQIAWRLAGPLSTHILAAWEPAITEAVEAVRADDGSADELPPAMLTAAQQVVQWHNSGQYTEDQIAQFIKQGSVAVEHGWWLDNRATIMATAPSSGWDWRHVPLLPWTLWLVLGLATGAVWSAILLSHRVRGRLAIAAIIPILAALIAWAKKPDPYDPNLSWGLALYYTPGYAGTIAQAELWAQATVVIITLFLIPFLIGLIFGRPIIRLLARLLLTPRMRLAIAPLWLCDGKTPPRIHSSGNSLRSNSSR